MSAFPEIFFPKLPPTQALVFSYLAYAAGHPARLLGAFIFGHFGDRAGRKFAFLINIVVVGASTCLTGLLPRYATIGIAAPMLIEKFNLEAGIRAAHVPAQPGDAITDVIANTVAGRTTYMMAPIQLALVDIRAGNLRALGVTT